jgi:hypothetical protein
MNVKISTEKVDELKSVIIDFDEPDTVICFDNGMQLSFEKHSFLNHNNYLLTVLLIRHTKEVNISLACGGASTGLFFKFDWGTEVSAIKKLFNEIELYCQANEIEYVILDDHKLE